MAATSLSLPHLLFPEPCTRIPATPPPRTFGTFASGTQASVAWTAFCVPPGSLVSPYSPGDVDSFCPSCALLQSQGGPCVPSAVLSGRTPAV